ncbi:LCP family protein [Corynebacterium sp. DNF00584]
MSPDMPRPVRDIKPAPTRARSLTQAGSTSLKVVLAVVAVLVMLVSGTGYALVGRLGGELGSIDNLSLGNGDKGFKDGNNADGAMDILLVGSDSRVDAQGNTLSQSELDALHAGVDDGEHNTDTIMVIRIPNDGSRASAISIPRDTYINNGPEYGNMKINGVFSAHESARKDELAAENLEAEQAGEKPKYTDKDIAAEGTAAGRAALLEQVRDLTGIEIDHYAEIGLVGFVLLTEAVGGVDVCLNAPVKEELSGADFPAGQQTLNGAQGLAFVRQRHELPRGDLDRIARQQAFTASLVSKLLSSDTLTNPSKLSKLSTAVERSVSFDSNWDIMSLASQLSGLAGGNVTFNTIPVTSIDGQGDYGESIVTVDVAEVHRFFDDLAKTAEETSESATPSATDTGEKPVADNLEIHVLNAGDVSGLAGGVGSWLEKVGYTVARTANADPGIYSESQVVAADPESETAKKFAEQLGGLPITANANLDENTLIVVTGNDYTGPSDQAQTDASAAEDSTSEEPVGTPGADFGTAEVSPEISAGGDSPRCVN